MYQEQSQKHAIIMVCTIGLPPRKDVVMKKRALANLAEKVFVAAKASGRPRQNCSACYCRIEITLK